MLSVFKWSTTCFTGNVDLFIKAKCLASAAAAAALCIDAFYLFTYLARVFVWDFDVSKAHVILILRQRSLFCSLLSFGALIVYVDTAVQLHYTFSNAIRPSLGETRRGWKFLRVSDSRLIKWLGKSCHMFELSLHLNWAMPTSLPASIVYMQQRINSLASRNMHILPL